MNTCPICMDDLIEGNITTTSCGHSFCKNCLCGWVNTLVKREAPHTCPVCWSNISDEFSKRYY